MYYFAENLITGIIMDLKFPEFSTVIIVNKGQGQTRSLQIKTKHLKRFKHYASALAFLILGLCLSVVYLNMQNNRQTEEKHSLLMQLVRLKGEKPLAEVKTTKGISAHAYIQSIEAKLQKINDYLRKRGINKEYTNASARSKTENTKLSNDEQYSLYNNYLDHLVSTVAFTPMGYPRISSMTSFYGYRKDPFNADHPEYHPGIDFKGQKGDEVKCTANGKVVFAGWRGGYGNCICIKHANNFETLYGHLSKIKVKIGQNVNLGDVIGAVGSTGHSTGAHLHYEVRKNGKPVNPVKFLELNS